MKKKEIENEIYLRRAYQRNLVSERENPFLIAQPKGWRLLHMETLCVCVKMIILSPVIGQNVQKLVSE